MSDRVNIWTGWTMRICAVIGAAVILAGLLLENDDITLYGLIIVIAAPLLGLLVAMLALCVQREFVWASVTFFLIGLFSLELIDRMYSAIILAAASAILAIAYLQYRRGKE